MGNLELLSRWRILPFHLLLAQRRFGWLQSMVAQPQHSEQVLAALFGRLEIKADRWSVQLSSLDPSGKLSSDFRSPLAEGFVAAFETYRGISGTESFFELWLLTITQSRHFCSRDRWELHCAGLSLPYL